MDYTIDIIGKNYVVVKSEKHLGIFTPNNAALGQMKLVFGLYKTKGTFESFDQHSLKVLFDFVSSVTYNHLIFSEEEYTECKNVIEEYVKEIWEDGKD